MYGFRLKSVAATAVATGSLLALAACGPLGSSASDSKDGDKTTAPTAASSSGDQKSGIAHAISALDLVKKTTSGANSARVQESITMGTTMSMQASGVMDWKSGLKGNMTMRYTGGTIKDQLKQSGIDGPMQARYLTDAYYVNMGDAMADQIGGKHWIRYGYDDLAKLSGASGSYMKDALQNNTPVKGVEVALASPDTQDLGDATVNGVQTKHYRSTLTADELTSQGNGANLSEADRKELKTLLDKGGITSETIDLWVSEDNLPVKTVTSAKTAAGAMTTTCTYSNFGTPVHVSAPDSSDTADFNDLMNQTQQ